jgi:hypothetical protein
MTDTANLGLPCIEGSQAQKHVTHNDALRILDTLVQLAVADRDLSAPPASPAEGQRWIVKPTATGLWTGHDNAIAAWQDGAWQFSVPQTGWSAFVVDEGVLLVWNGTAWGDFFSAVGLQNISLLGVGTTADATNPLSAKLNNTLFVAKTAAEGGSGDLRYKLSKESAANTLSFLFQDNYSGRAEFGLAGDDDFHFKVSADGATWVDALKLNKTSGAATLASSATAAAFIPSGSALPVNGIYLPSANTVGIAANSTQIWTGTSATIAVKPTTAATSTTTGALTVAGGVGIAGSLFVGSQLNIAGDFTGGNVAGFSAPTGLKFAYSSNCALSLGQDSTHTVLLYWHYNATAANAWAELTTYGYSLPLSINASTLQLQSMSGNGVQIRAPTGGDKGAGTLNLASGIYINGSQIIGGSSVPVNGIYLPAANTLGWATNSTARGKIDANGNFIFGTAALATNAANGYIYIPTCAGTPTGTPTAVTGMVPLVYDTTNHKLYVYDGGWKGGTAPGAWS